MKTVQERLWWKMKTYRINGKKYVLRDFMFGELDKVQELKQQLAPELFGNGKKKKLAITTSTSGITEIVNYILETENGEKPEITENDINNTGMREFTTMITDFLLHEIMYAEEKKRALQSLITSLNVQ